MRGRMRKRYNKCVNFGIQHESICVIDRYPIVDRYPIYNAWYIDRAQPPDYSMRYSYDAHGTLSSYCEDKRHSHPKEGRPGSYPFLHGLPLCLISFVPLVILRAIGSARDQERGESGERRGTNLDSILDPILETNNGLVSQDSPRLVRDTFSIQHQRRSMESVERLTHLFYPKVQVARYIPHVTPLHRHLDTHHSTVHF